MQQNEGQGVEYGWTGSSDRDVKTAKRAASITQPGITTNRLRSILIRKREDQITMH